MADPRATFYARVSSEAQARNNTIASQVAALRERIRADGAVLDPDLEFVDDGHSGATLRRPALERLRDGIAVGQVDRVYVLAPDRLARRHAHQALLVEEFRRAGVEVCFLNRPIGASPEDDLLLQIQGVVAEYERAQILERGRRGRRHAARRLSQRFGRSALWLPVCNPGAGRRGGAVRDRAGGGAHRPLDFRLGGAGTAQPA
jgi:Site-specific recombinases, DNA invertase Pin homologs